MRGPALDPRVGKSNPTEEIPHATAPAFRFPGGRQPTPLSRYITGYPDRHRPGWSGPASPGGQDTVETFSGGFDSDGNGKATVSKRKSQDGSYTETVGELEISDEKAAVTGRKREVDLTTVCLQHDRDGRHQQ